MRYPAICSIALFALAGCDSNSPADRKAEVSFEIDAPLCSSQIPVIFYINGLEAGQDTFRVNLTNEHLRSRSFEVDAGDNVLGARVVSGLVWPDTTVSLSPGDTLTHLLPFYCS